MINDCRKWYPSNYPQKEDLLGFRLAVYSDEDARLLLMLSCHDVFILRALETVLDFPGDLMVQNLPAMQETWVQFLGQEDLLEKRMDSIIESWPTKGHNCTGLCPYIPVEVSDDK